MLNYFTFLGCYCYLNELKFYISLNACIRTWCGPSFPNSYTLFCTILATSVLFLVTFMYDILAHFLLRKHTFVHFHEVLSQPSHQLDHDLGIHEIVAFSRSPISIQPPTGPWLRNSRNRSIFTKSYHNPLSSGPCDGFHEIATQEYFGLLQWNHYKLPIS